MSSSSSSSSSSGVGVFGLLGVAFVVLKLTGFIDWSWWWVTAPFWGGLALFLIIVVGVALFVYLSDKNDKRKLKKYIAERDAKRAAAIEKGEEPKKSFAKAGGIEKSLVDAIKEQMQKGKI